MDLVEPVPEHSSCKFTYSSSWVFSFLTPICFTKKLAGHLCNVAAKVFSTAIQDHVVTDVVRNAIN